MFPPARRKCFGVELSNGVCWPEDASVKLLPEKTNGGGKPLEGKHPSWYLTEISRIADQAGAVSVLPDTEAQGAAAWVWTPVDGVLTRIAVSASSVDTLWEPLYQALQSLDDQSHP